MNEEVELPQDSKAASTGFRLMGMAITSILLSLIYWLAPLLFSPQFSDVRVQPENQLPYQTQLPVLIERDVKEMYLSLHFKLPSHYSPELEIQVDDCIEILTVDKKSLPDFTTIKCDWTAWYPLRLEEYRNPEGHALFLKASNQNRHGLVSIRVSPRDPANITFRIVLGILTSVLICQLLHIFVIPKNKNRQEERWIVGACGFAVSVMLLYFYGTPLFVRSHDTWGHINYLRHVAAYFTIPEPTQCWECWHTPLYYYFSAFIYRAAEIMQWSGYAQLEAVSFASLVMMLAALILKCKLATTLFPPSRRYAQALVILISALTPVVVFHTTTINDDTPQHLLVCAFAIFLLSWWQSPNSKNWYLVVLLASLSALTKSSGLCYLFLAFFLLVLQAFRRKQSRNFLIMAAGGIGIFLLTNGWYYLWRYSMQAENPVFGSSNTLLPTQGIPTTIGTLFTFNPFNLFSDPYLPWKDRELRSHFWEVLFRTALFDENSYTARPLALIYSMITSGLILTSLALIGVALKLRNDFWATLPLVLLLATAVGSIFGFRLLHPLVSTQEFRYATFAFFPIAYFAIQAAGVLPRMMKLCAFSVLWVYVASCSCFLAWFYFV